MPMAVNPRFCIEIVFIRAEIESLVIWRSAVPHVIHASKECGGVHDCADAGAARRDLIGYHGTACQDARRVLCGMSVTMRCSHQRMWQVARLERANARRVT